MNRIVRNHYPADKLPEDLRRGFPPNTSVTIVIETHDDDDQTKPLTKDEAVEKIRQFKELDRPSLQSGEAVARIRQVRDEWEND